MMMPSDESYDAIIIGSGLGGLSSAVHLAKEGMKVLVLEKQPKAGGYAQNYLRDDYIFDVSLHILPALAKDEGLRLLFEDMGIYDKIEPRQHDPMYHCVFPEGDYLLPAGGKALQDFLKKEFPHEKAGLEGFFGTIERLVKDNMELFMTGEVDFAAFFPAQYYGKTYKDLLEEFLSDKKLMAILGQLWQSTGLPDDKVSANWGVEVNGWHLLSGNYYVKGGGQSITGALVRRVEELGGRVMTSSLVESILAEGRQVSGVVCADGSRYTAPLIVSNVGPYQTFLSLIGEDQFNAAYLDKFRSLDPSCSLLTLYMGLDCPAKHLGITEHTTFVNFTYDNTQAFDLAMNENYAETDYMVSDYTDDESGCHPKGRGIIQVAEVAPGAPWTEISRDEYEKKKKETLERILNKVSRRYPDLRDHIVTMELATPRTMMHSTRNPWGCVYGFAQTPSQADSNRFGAMTSFRGLYLAGAWCRGGGGGYMGSIINGRVAARQILKSKK